MGRYKNRGREWQPAGAPEEVNVHDFMGEAGKAIPYGVYDVAADAGWVSVGTDHDTSAFAVASLRRWWQAMGQPLYPDADRLLVCADGGGSNGYRTRLWKVELAALAADTCLTVTVCHLPPGTSKWNKIEHRLFSHLHALARPTADRPRNHRAADRGDCHPQRPDGAGRTRRGHLPQRRQSQRCTNGPPCRWPATTSTASGTTPSTLNNVHVIYAQALRG